jgi:heparanase
MDSSIENKVSPIMKTLIKVGFALAVSGAVTGCATMAEAGGAAAPQAAAKTIAFDAAALPFVREMDERFQSFQLGFSHLTGGDTWVSFENMTPEMVKEREYTGDLSSIREPRAPTDLSNTRFRKLVSALAPLYIRYGGTTTNTVYFQNNEEPKLQKAPPGYKTVLTRKRWREAVEFAKAVGAKIYTGFSVGHGVRNEAGVWTPIHAKPWLDYTRSIGGEIYAAELFNEPNMEGHSERLGNYTAQDFARDYALFREFITKAAPEIKLVGPSDVATGRQGALAGILNTEDYLAAEPEPQFDIISYHFYPALSDRCAPNSDNPMAIEAENALSEEYLARQDEPFQYRKGLRDRFAPGAPIWNTETGGAACGGTRWQTTFLDTFRFLDTQARLAKQGMDAIFTHAILSGSNGVIDEKTFMPNADYWAALMWRRLMGTKILDAGPIEERFHVYAHCQRGVPGGVTVLAINLQDKAARIVLDGPVELYALTAPELQSRTVLLNAVPLELGPNDSVPETRPARQASGDLMLAPTSVNFIALPDAANPACKT